MSSRRGARGHGLARGVTAAVEDAARAAGFRVLNLDVRETQTPALAMYEARGYVRWGSHPALRAGRRPVMSKAISTPRSCDASMRRLGLITIIRDDPLSRHRP
ncbi:MAG: GNAT family N-acetyltransferase [Pseudomonadota bacterium]